MKYKAGLSITSYCKEVIIPLMIQVSVVAGACWLCTTYIMSPYRFVVTIICGITIGLACGCFIVLNSSERDYTKNIIKKMIRI